MTVIAYKSGVMAADSRTTYGSTIVSSRAKKIFRLPSGALLGSAGDDDIRILLDMLAKATPRKLPSRKELANTATDFSGILVFPKGEVFELGIGIEHYPSHDEWDGFISEVPERIAAVGSGSVWAISAMRLGKTAKQAVQHAIAMDAYCGGPIQSAVLVPRKR